MRLISPSAYRYAMPRTQCRLANAIAFVCGMIVMIPAVSYALPRSYFEMTETFSADVVHFPKWNGMVSRHIEQLKLPASQCDRMPYYPCLVQEWRRFLEGVQARPLTAQLESINDFGNAFPYTIDQINWALEDYWETPYEFFTVSGDCEDYAITKYYSLRALGVSADRLRIIIVQDFNLGGIIHAILGVYSGDELFILDNQIRQVVPARKIYHYKPIYGINEQGWWAYFPR